MRKSTTHLLVLIMVLVLTDFSHYVVSAQQRKINEVQSVVTKLENRLVLEKSARQEDQELYRGQLLNIVEAVYTKETRMGGYTTEAGIEVTSIYDAIMNDARDYHSVLDITENYFNARVDYIEDIPSIWPVSYSSAIYITSGFGMRYDPFTGRLSFHPAIDIAGPRGTRIFATASGIVGTHYPSPNEYWEGHDLFGGYIEITHDHGYKSRYAHMKRTDVHEGDYVERGQPIGIMGSTGSSTGLHLHYEVLFNEQYIDPADLLQF